MKLASPIPQLLATAALVGSLSAQAADLDRPQLIGWALLPAATFADGPTSGQFAAPNPYGTHLPPYANRQPVQGFSGILRGTGRGSFHMLVDNGFGGRANSADALLRMYAVSVDFRTRQGGAGTVQGADWISGRAVPGFGERTRITLNDANHQLGLPIQADNLHYYGNPARPMVDAAIRSGRLLTGADLDIESVRRDKRGNYWFGDEFGPYLVKTDAQGTVLRNAIPLPGVFAPENIEVARGAAVANLGGSGGFEGMAIDASGSRLYTLLEKTVAGDPARTLRINEFDLTSEAYTGVVYFYPLDAGGTAIGDMTAIDDERFVVIERNGATTTSAPAAGVPFKKLFLIDLSGVASGGVVTKTELVDLMNLSDPDDLDRDGKTVYTMPYVTIENVLLQDARTLIVVNDNNFPYGGGRAASSDNTEFIRIRLPVSLESRAGKRGSERDDRDDH